MIRESISKYPRLYLFIKKETNENKQLIPVKEKTISEWIRNFNTKQNFEYWNFQKFICELLLSKNE